MSWEKPSPEEALRRAEAEGAQLGHAIAIGVALEQASPDCKIGKTIPPRSRSGSVVSYAERSKAGWTRVSAELDEQTLRRLDEMVADDGGTRADMIRAMIDMAWAEWQETLGKKSTGG